MGSWQNVNATGNPPQQIDPELVTFQETFVITGDDQKIQIPITPPYYQAGSVRITVEFLKQDHKGEGRATPIPE